MDSTIKKILYAVFISFLIISLLILFILNSNKCKPHCSGIYCGPNSSDGCGNTCQCKEGGICKNGFCCYPNCKGIACGSDGCGGTCSNKCDAVPNGSCMPNKQCDGCPDGECLVNGTCQKSNTCCPPGQCKSSQGICIPANICCYAQDCNNVYCGPNGCGGQCGCQAGATCSDTGICVNSGTPGWSYTVYDSNSVERTNVKDAISCAGWNPKNAILNLQNFPCEDDNDCPYLQQCVAGKDGKKFCNRNNIFQYWYFDPADPSGYNCAKILAGSTVCGIQKPGASGFDIIGNVGPDKSVCGLACSISPVCPQSGPGSCCPETWTVQGTTAHCVDSSSKTQCCLNNPELSGYSDCIASGFKDCSQLSDAWMNGNMAEITSVCDQKVTGSNIAVNRANMSDFLAPCQGLSPSDSCTGQGYSGFCKSCTDGKLRCFPEKMCVNNYASAGQQNGTCSSQTVC